MKTTSRIISLIAAALLLSSCGANEGILKSGKETPASGNSATSATEFDRDLETVRNADFRWVYVLRRKDGGVIDAEDRGVIKINTSDANRRVSSDGDKAFIIGTNIPIAPSNMLALYGRFAVEDRSPQPPPSSNAPSNANSNK